MNPAEPPVGSALHSRDRLGGGQADIRPLSRRRALGWLAAAATCTAVASCAPGRDLVPLSETPPSAYRLGPGDEIRIITVNGDQLNGNFRVNDSGDIALPLLGTVHAAGLGTSQLGQRIADALRQNHLFQNPSVSIEVVTYRPIFILGEVSKPGQYPYQPGMTLLTAVSIAGGFTYRAVTDYASVVRLEGDHALEGRVERQSLIRPGDVITIFERFF